TADAAAHRAPDEPVRDARAWLDGENVLHAGAGGIRCGLPLAGVDLEILLQGVAESDAADDLVVQLERDMQRAPERKTAGGRDLNQDRPAIRPALDPAVLERADEVGDVLVVGQYFPRDRGRGARDERAMQMEYPRRFIDSQRDGFIGGPSSRR